MSVLDWVSGRVFKFVHGNNLVYNTCWEDPRLDRVALQIQPTDNILVITSAGCNALDYALCGPHHVYAVDMNPRQNALLDLKIAGIKTLEFEDFFRLFGYGFHPDARRLYQRQMRPALPAWSQAWWDQLDQVLRQPGPAVLFPRHQRRLRAADQDLYRPCHPGPRRTSTPPSKPRRSPSSAKSMKSISSEKFWSRPMRFAMNRDTTLSMVGVPKAQRRQVESQYEGGVVKFMQDAVEAVFCKLPLADNYFWRVYMKGEYSRACCPEYLKADNFERLKAGLVERVSTHTNSVQGFLEGHDGQISKYVLLDHMDWLSDKFFPLLELEWQAILRRAAPGTRIIWRSGGLQTDYLNRVNVTANGRNPQAPRRADPPSRSRRRPARKRPRPHLRQLLHRRPGNLNCRNLCHGH